jgi:hypothetical protein
MELREALTQISEIRAQMAQSQVFRGYRSVTAGISAGVAVLAALLQPLLVADPARDLIAYVALWGSAAALSMLVVGVEMFFRLRRMESAVQSQLTMLAVEQFVPSVMAGALLTAICLGVVPSLGATLPGFWMIFFALGVFASSRVLPRPTFWVAGFYLLAGTATLCGQGRWALSPWTMGGVFGVGQTLAAVVLYRGLERRDMPGAA